MFGKSIRLVRILGISIELDLSWFIIFIFISWSLSRGYFPYYYPEISRTNYLFMGIVAAILLFLSVLIHELAHSVIALRNKLPISKITLFIFGGVASMDEEPKTPGVEFRVAFAGPLSSFVLMLIFYLLLHIVPERGAFYAVFEYAGFINGFLAFFNLIPGFPLDGGRLLRSAMWHFTGNLKASTLTASSIGKGFAYILMGFGFLQVMMGRSFNGLWLILIGFFLQNAAEGSYRQVIIKEFLVDLLVDKVMNPNVFSVSKEMNLNQVVDEYFVAHHCNNFPVVHGDEVVGAIRISEVKRVPREKRGETIVEDIMEKDLAPFLVRPEDAVETVLARMVKDNMGWFIVVEENNRLCGILTRSDIMHLLQIKSGLDE